MLFPVTATSEAISCHCLLRGQTHTHFNYRTWMSCMAFSCHYLLRAVICAALQAGLRQRQSSARAFQQLPHPNLKSPELPELTQLLLPSPPRSVVRPTEPDSTLNINCSGGPPPSQCRYSWFAPPSCCGLLLRAITIKGVYEGDITCTLQSCSS